MPSLMVIPLSGKERGKALIFDQKVITLGTDKSCDLQVQPLSSDAKHIIAEIYQQQHNFEFFFRDPEHSSLHINHKQYVISESNTPILISDGDLIAFESINESEQQPSIELLFHLVQEIDVSDPTGKLQFPEVDKGGRIHPRTATRFARELVVALYAEIPSWARVVAVLLTILIPLSILVATSIVFFGVARYHEVLDTFSRLSSGAEKQIDDQMERIRKLEEDNKLLRQTITFAPQIAQTYSAGVCLIQGSYIYKDKQTNQPLRYLDRSFNQGVAISADGKINVSFDGTGDVYAEELTGTGFSISAGNILTNRHIAEPWWRDTDARILMKTLGGQPEINELYAYFPGVKKRFNLLVKKVSKENDVALCGFDSGDLEIPQLLLDESEDIKDSTGQPIVLLGYPRGVDAIIETQVSDETLKEDLRRLVSASECAMELAKRGYIRPKVTQGHITLFVSERIVHDAATTNGGSGSPIFNINGKVIGINAQALIDEKGLFVPGSNIGIPISAARDLIQAANEENN